MLKPMPSPRGTNVERLFIRASGPAAAYDAAGVSDLMDEEHRARLEDAFAKLNVFLQQKLPQDDQAAAKSLVELLLDAAMGSSPGATDEPPNFPGKPLVGGKQVAQDAKARLRAAAAKTAAAKNAAARYPDAAKIKHA
jgi:hypothetical protein